MRTFQILGPIEVWAEGRRLALSGRRQVALLSFLLLHRNRAVSSGALIVSVWGPERDGAEKRLQMAVVRLRRALAPLGHGRRPVLQTVGGGYLLVVDVDELDASVFERLVRTGRRMLDSDPEAAGRILVEALGLWRGPALADVRFEDFAQSEIARLEELRLAALEARVEADLRCGRSDQVVGELEALVAEHPLREMLTGQLMLALYRSGRQSDALSIYQRSRTRLREELGLEPDPTLQRLQRDILNHAPELVGDPAQRPPPDARAHRHIAQFRLPPSPDFLIGRDRELEVLTSMLVRPEVRVLCLTGPGGVGKTRLALAVARALADEFLDRVGWIELAAVEDATEVAAAIVRGLAITAQSGESPRDALVRVFGNGRLLLVLDNFEHVLAGALLVSDLIAACPGLSVLATSRQSLDVSAERRVVVEPLAVPVPRAELGLNEIEATDGTALFLAEARRRDSRFTISAPEAPVVAAICARLDGIPLALELAAGQAALLGLSYIAENLDQLDDLASGPRDAPDRHRSVRQMIDWSYRLLDADQRETFASFAVFAGGATLAAAEEVTGASVPQLKELCAKSLLEIRRDPSSDARLVMLETVRHYALERLAEYSSPTELRCRHFRYFAGLLKEHVQLLATHEQPRALGVLGPEVANLRAALRWALAAAPADAVSLACDLTDYFLVAGDSDALEWLDRAIRGAEEAVPPRDRARAHLQRARRADYRSDGEETIAAARSAVAIFSETGDSAGVARALCCLAPAVGEYEGDVALEREYAKTAVYHARVASEAGLIGRALARLAPVAGAETWQLLDEASAILERIGDRRAIATAYNDAAYVALGEGREALQLADEALAAAERSGDLREISHALGTSGLANLFAGDLERASDMFERQLQLTVDYRFDCGGESLAGLGAIAAACSDDQTSATLRGAARSLGYPPATFDRLIDNRLDHDYFADARARLGTIAWRQAERAGETLAPADAIAYTLKARGEREVPPTPPANRSRQRTQ